MKTFLELRQLQNQGDPSGGDVSYQVGTGYAQVFDTSHFLKNIDDDKKKQRCSFYEGDCRF